MRYASQLRQLSLDAAMSEIGRAWSCLKAGDPATAHRLLGELIAREPDFAPARELMAYACQMGGDLEAAEREIRLAVALDKSEPAFRCALAEILAARGDPGGAEAAFAAALSRDRQFLRAVEGMAGLMLQQGRAQDALAALKPVVMGKAAPPPLPILGLHVEALRALRRPEEARDLLAAGPDSGETRALLAAVLEDLGDTAGAETATRRALESGIADPDAWARLGRLLQARGELDGAEQACRQALAGKPDDAPTHAALAEVMWMRTGDVGRTLEDLDAALRRRPSLTLLTLKSRLMRQTGLAIGAYALLAEAAINAPANAALKIAAANAAAAADRLPDMLAQARAALAIRPDDAIVRRTLADALLRSDDFAAALAILGALLERDPGDQQAITLQALAWRGLGDPRYGRVYDYERLVRGYTIATPPGWPDLGAFLAELSGVLRAMHRFDIHPLDQSLRGGTQTSHNLALTPHAVIKAFFAAVETPVRRYIVEVEPPAAKGRRPPGHRIEAAWSVKLKPDGFHVSHLHPDGWISSAFYVEVPQAVDLADRPGWLQFGDPGTVMTTPMPADHFVKPAPGRLVLFPSYMLHGTRPFPGDAERLTIAFDVVRT